MFHVALKFQYLHTSAMYFCAGYIEDPWGCGRKPRNKGARRRQWWADNAHRRSHGYAPPPAPPSSASGVSGVPGVSAPAVVVVDDEEGGEKAGPEGVSGVSDVQNAPQPSHQRRKGNAKAAPMPDALKRQAKIKAKPMPRPPATPPPTHAGAKRKNSRSPGAGIKRKEVRLQAAPSASSAPSHSGDPGVSGVASAKHMEKPLEGKTFKIYSGGKHQASNRDFQSPS